MQQRSKSGFIRDWLSATAKDDRYQCTFQNRTSIPYGKGKVAKECTFKCQKQMYQFPMGKVKVKIVVKRYEAITYQFPMGKVKSHSTSAHKKIDPVSIPYGKG